MMNQTNSSFYYYHRDIGLSNFVILTDKKELCSSTLEYFFWNILPKIGMACDSKHHGISVVTKQLVLCTRIFGRMDGI